MRLIHTADWHLGQSFHGYDRNAEHQCVLQALLDALQQEQADALLIAGDVFDSAHPSTQAQKQLYEFLAAAHQRCPQLQTLIIAGNHDSAVRLEVAVPLLHAFGTRIIGQLPRLANGAIDHDALILPLQRRDGSIGAWCLAVPFLRPSDLPPPSDPGDDAYLAGIAELYRELTARALQRRAPGQALIAMGHCHLVGSALSPDSERRIVIGGAEALPASLFDPQLAYVALGHLHRAQQIGSTRLRYSGSPLPLSFAERDYRHQLLSIELQGEQLDSVRSLPLPRSVALLRVPERPAPLAEVLRQLQALQLPDLPTEQQAYLEVRVQLDGPQPDLRSQIEAAIGELPLRLARIELSRPGAAAASNEAPAESLDELGRIDPLSLFERHYRQRHGDAPAPALLAAFVSLLNDGAP